MHIVHLLLFFCFCLFVYIVSLCTQLGKHAASQRICNTVVVLSITRHLKPDPVGIIGHDVFLHCPVLVRRFFTCSTNIGCT